MRRCRIPSNAFGRIGSVKPILNHRWKWCPWHLVNLFQPLRNWMIRHFQKASLKFREVSFRFKSKVWWLKLFGLSFSKRSNFWSKLPTCSYIFQWNHLKNYTKSDGFHSFRLYLLECRIHSFGCSKSNFEGYHLPSKLIRTAL